MSTRRSSVARLARLLDAVEEEIYILDGDLRIVYLNRACREWLGPLSEGLLDVCCAYRSDHRATGPGAVAAALCPPPSVLTGRKSAAPVHRIDHEEGGGIFSPRLASFLPLKTINGELFAVIATLTAEAVDEPPQMFSPDEATSDEAEQIALHEQLRQFRGELAVRFRDDRLIGEGAAMRLARSQATLAAEHRANVLIVGPPGSGRQRLAAAIHYGRDKMDAGAFVPLDCSLLGADLIEAASSAIVRSAARDEDAGTATLLLHRVDELAADVQVELHDFISSRLTGWRLAATAGESLVELARRGQFHAELAATLSTIAIELPPLAERRGDIPLLAQMFLEECNAAGQRQLGGFSTAALDRLDAYHWPGDVDELADVVADAHRRAAGHEIGLRDLPERLRFAVQAAAHPSRPEETIVLDEFLGRIERELIHRALAKAKGNKAHAARLLGVTRPRLYRRMVQLGLE